MAEDRQHHCEQMENELMLELEEEQKVGAFSPRLLHVHEDEEAVDPKADQAELIRKREAVMKEHKRKVKEAMAAKAAVAYELELKALKAIGAMEEGDTTFGSEAEVNLDSQAYWWHDKYRPRKPKYFNRVHTGYEWTKYNQTHYNHDNPPPKVVQGYKFNIFYADLIDKTKVPTYTIEKDGNGEACIIRFHAGPPYEDTNCEQGMGILAQEKGFKCSFEHGIMHLYVNFKRHMYRRRIEA